MNFAAVALLGMSVGQPAQPLAAQLVGRYFDERRLFTLAAAVATVAGQSACPMLLED